ncbi:MAG: hypothetical protein Kow0073_04230 [Immundisolibacter sp.]
MTEARATIATLQARFEKAANTLQRAVRFRSAPKAIRTDQGPEFTGKALDQWAYENGVQLKLIQAGKPTQNAFIDRFNGRFRNESLNEHRFTSLAHAREEIAARRRDYNEARPHSSLGYQTPAAGCLTGETPA